MISDLIKKKYFIGETREKIKATLGESTGGYYNSDINLTYRVYEKGSVVWGIIFIIDSETRKAEKVLIYKSYGSLTRMILGNLMESID